MASPSTIVQTLRHERTARRLDAALRDAGLEALGLPSQGEASIGRPLATIDQRAVLARYVLDVIERAGLADAFRALLIHDALRRGDRALCDALGIPEVQEEGSPNKRRVLPSGVPLIRDHDGVGHAVARQLTAAIATEHEHAEQERDADEY